MFDSVMQMLSATSMIILLIFLPIQPNYHNSLYGDVSEVSRSRAAMPTINDPNLKVDTIFRGLNFPTSMAFLACNDILVLEKNNGTVQRIVNGKILAEPVLNVSVANKGERGMLGIATAKNSTRNQTYIFVYYTQSGGGRTGDDATQGIHPLGN